MMKALILKRYGGAGQIEFARTKGAGIALKINAMPALLTT